MDELWTHRRTSRLPVGDRAYFRAFGFLKLPGYFAADLVAELGAEARRAIEWTRAAPGNDLTSEHLVAAGHLPAVYVPLAGERAPVARSLVEGDDLRLLAEELLRVPCVPRPGKAVEYAADSHWHADSTRPGPAVKFATYFEVLHASNGAIRFIPCSNACGDRLKQYDDLLAYYEGTGEPLAPPTSPVPAVEVPTSPGDLVVFDPRIWHGSSGGRRRIQWNMSFLGVSGDLADRPEERAAVAEAVRMPAGFVDTGDYPYFSPRWHEPTTSVGIERLRALGAVGGRRTQEAR